MEAHAASKSASCSVKIGLTGRAVKTASKSSLDALHHGEVAASPVTPVLRWRSRGLSGIHSTWPAHSRGAATRSAATAMYRGMGMTFWLEKAEAEIQELA